MKLYTAPNHFTLVGKAWQIRGFLRQFRNKQTTLQAYLSTIHPPHS